MPLDQLRCDSMHLALLRSNFRAHQSLWQLLTIYMLLVTSRRPWCAPQCGVWCCQHATATGGKSTATVVAAAAIAGFAALPESTELCM